MKVLILALFLSAFIPLNLKTSPDTFDVQGHRGCRGLMPENSIPAFLKAANLGVTTLEMDVVISGDGKVVVSHDPFFDPQFCLDPKGKKIKKGKEGNLFQMQYSEIKLYDCGGKGNKEFKEQKPFSVYKPLLEEVIDEVEKYCSSRSYERPDYNIEIKSKPSTDGIFHPNPDVYAEKVMEIVNKKGLKGRVSIQSFDPRPLIYLHQKYPDIKLVALVYPGGMNREEFFSILGFDPAVYSPHFSMVTEMEVKEMHQKGIKVIPWTVNEEGEMQKLIKLGVDGIITDYPDKLLELIQK